MIKSRAIPVLLLRNRGLVKGVRFRNHRYVGDPMNAVRIFNDKKADEIVLLDIAATAEGRAIDTEFLQRVADESYMPFGAGGGIRNIGDIRGILRAGAEKVIINTAAFSMPGLVKEAALTFGSQSIAVGIDIHRRWTGKREVYVCSGLRPIGLDPVDWAETMVQAGAGEIVLTSIDRDGTGRGYDIELIRIISQRISVPIIACGGAGKYEDLEAAVKEGGAAAVAAGRLFVFHGPHDAVLINYPDIEWRSRHLGIGP